MTSARNRRDTWPDVAKGIGIILVVIGHVWRGLAEAGIPMDQTLFQAVDRGIYLFHMPLFFFMSGWFFPRTMRRGTTGAQIGRMALRLLYPMVIWTYLFILVKIAAGGAANDPVFARDLLRWPLPPYLHLWFLWALFLLQAGGLMLRGVPDRVLPLFCVALSMLAVVIAWGDFPLGWMFAQAMYGAPFFFLAAGLSYRTEAWPSGPKAVLAAVLLFAMVEYVVLSSGLHAGLALQLGALLCVLAVVTLARAPLVSRQGWLIALGRASMIIYLTHTIFAAAVRIGLVQAGVTDLGPHLVLGVGAGVVLPLLLQMERVPLWLRQILGSAPWDMPAFLTRRSAS